MNSKSLVNCFVWNLFWVICKKKKKKKKTFSECPQKFCHRFMYIAPSSGCYLLNRNMPFKLILRRFEIVFWCLEWECCTFQNIDENSFKSINTILWLKNSGTMKSKSKDVWKPFFYDSPIAWYLEELKEGIVLKMAIESNSTFTFNYLL